METRRARPTNIRVDFFIEVLHWGRYWQKSGFVNAEKCFSVVPITLQDEDVCAKQWKTVSEVLVPGTDKSS
jgi:hypothetical protein